MQMLSDDDRNLVDLTDEELHAAWDLWFDLAQSTNDADPPYTHGVFVNVRWDPVDGGCSPWRGGDHRGGAETLQEAPAADRDGDAAGGPALPNTVTRARVRR